MIQYLQEKLGNDRVRFHTGVQYRHLLVIKGGNKELDCTPPHDVPLKPFRPLMVKPLVPEAQETADLINDLILKSQELQMCIRDSLDTGHQIFLSVRAEYSDGKL